MNLIRKLLKAEVLRQDQFTRSSFGVFQGNIVFSIFANIYFNELDEWVKNKANILYQSHRNQRNKKYKQLSYQIGKRAAQMQQVEKNSNESKILLKEIKTLKIERATISSLDTNRTHLEYIRYSDDWMIGIKGNQTLIKELKMEVSYFLIVHLKQTVHSIKTKITNLRSDKAKFLGYEIYLPRNQKIGPYTGSSIRTTHITSSRLRFDISTDSILQKMEERGYIKKLVKGHRSISKASYTPLEDIVIVQHFAQIWRRLFNYYSKSTNLSKLPYIHSLLHVSCAMTLNHRHRSTTKKIFAQHGRKNGKDKLSLIYF
jgi:hypothetical protein